MLRTWHIIFLILITHYDVEISRDRISQKKELTLVVVVVVVELLSRVRLFATLWTVAHRAPLSKGFSRQEYWSGLLFPSTGDLPDPKIEFVSLAFPALAGRGFISASPGKPVSCLIVIVDSANLLSCLASILY